ncbi:hypothetical protein Tco_0704231 [Tanacetum coccineum]|uniref:Uncharacterized protein n=1 Tax=Tanacetum coccineum TaxID=301880 RepID=A0ABQ4Y214_9ASTR
MRCLSKNPFIGRETNVGNWFAGRVAQIRVAYHRTKHVMLNQDNQYVDEPSRMGQLVVPVYFNHSGAGLKLAGIIESVTTQPKQCYVVESNSEFADDSNAHQIIQASNSPEKNMLKNVNIKLVSS